MSSVQARSLTDAVVQVAPLVYEIPKTFRDDMRVPARVFASARQLESMKREESLGQLVNVATLPGIVDAAYGMPDMHEGYGFPVGGVAATLLPDGVISPGGIGFDINCGVRLLVSELERAEVGPMLERLAHELSRSVPTGAGRTGPVTLTSTQMDALLTEGVPFFIKEHGQGTTEDLERIEAGGHLSAAQAEHVSERAKLRGHSQLGTLGSGNHFLEVEFVETVFDEKAAQALGLALERIVVLIHTGSRGLGHQVCTDYVRIMDDAVGRYGIVVPDRQLACVPLSSPEGERYFSAMCAAANFGFANRQAITHKVRQVFRRILGDGTKPELRLIYDVGHNMAKIEHLGERSVCVHRKGATRAFGPSSDDLPAAYRGIGQPVFIPGSMGTASMVLVGCDRSTAVSLSSTCHGAGRRLSRGAAKRQVKGHELRKELERRGIVVRCPSNAELAEEAPLAYKDVEQVVDVVHQVGMATKVARLRPLAVIKG
jgi:tRNA-splicing ligase RtcB